MQSHSAKSSSPAINYFHTTQARYLSTLSQCFKSFTSGSFSFLCLIPGSVYPAKLLSRSLSNYNVHINYNLFTQTLQVIA